MNTRDALPIAEAQILEAVGAQRDEAVALLARLVAEPSLLGQEMSAQALMREQYAALGLALEEFAIDEAKLRAHEAYSPSLVSYEGRRNVVGLHRPTGPTRGRSLIVNGHIDVVPVGAEALWTHPPFRPVVQGDRLYGRGSADMKAGLVAAVMAVKALARLGYEPAAPLTLQSVIEEECTGNGALACMIQGYRADAALIPEPTQGLLHAQMGVMWLAIEVLGVPVHAAYAYQGVSAIDFAMHLVGKLRELEATWNRPENRHPLYCNHPHPVNFNLGKVSGGEWNSSVSTQARVDMRLGYYPGVKPAHVRAEVEALIERAHREHPARDGLRYRIVYGGFQSEGLVVDLEQPLVTELQRAHADISGEALTPQVNTATTDVKFFHLYGGMPCTCYGPQGADIHGIDEWVSIKSLQQVSAVYALFIARWCGLNRLN